MKSINIKTINHLMNTSIDASILQSNDVIWDEVNDTITKAISNSVKLSVLREIDENY